MRFLFLHITWGESISSGLKYKVVERQVAAAASAMAQTLGLEPELQLLPDPYRWWKRGDNGAYPAMQGNGNATRQPSYRLPMAAARVERGTYTAVRKGVELGWGEGQVLHSRGWAGHATEP